MCNTFKECNTFRKNAILILKNCNTYVQSDSTRITDENP